MLELKTLQIGYHGRALAALPGTEVRSGEFICLLGRNGQGKSTLLRTLAGFLAPVAGDVLLEDCPVRQWKPHERARRIAVVLTDRPNVGALGVTELVEMGRQPYTGWAGGLTDADRAIAADALEKVGGAHLAHRTVDSLSDGERQRVMIARALAQQPRVMLLDEITAFLDLPSRVTIIDTLRRIARDHGVAVILSSHDLELSLQTADRLWLLPGNGRFIDGAPEDVALSGAIGEAFDQPDLRFSITSGRFEAPASAGPSVYLDGDDDRTLWMERALQRVGLRRVHDPARADHRLSLVAQGWRVAGGPTLPNIQQVLAALSDAEHTAEIS